MVPYVDFTDSKGPLLWLIYGIGYLISHHSYVGVFWISVLFYTVTLFGAYKLCRLFVDKDVAAVSTAALPFFLFCCLIHDEVRSEDFCYPFVMVSLYCVCRILKYRDSDARTYFRLSALMGVCSICCVLIKYNIGVMVMTLMAVALYMAIRHKAGWQSFTGMAIGFVAPAIPFIICFLIYGNMGAFIQEYFLNTAATIENKNESLVPHDKRIFVLCSLLPFIWWFSKKYKIGYWLCMCLICFFIGMGTDAHHYYNTITMPFAVFLLIVLIETIVCKMSKWHIHIAPLCLIMGIVSICFNILRITNAYNKWNNESMYKAVYVMSQIKNPKIMDNFSIGVPVNALPACRYAIGQVGATKEMVEERERDFKRGVADFVFVYNPNEKEERIKEIESLGYVFYCKTTAYVNINCQQKEVALFGRPGLRLPPENFHVSQWDVWLKRNIFGI